MNPPWVDAINIRDLDMLGKIVTPETVNEFVMVHFALWSPLQYACSRGYVEGVKCLLKMGAKPNLNDGKGWVALHLAASSCSTECVRLLLEAGADLNVRNQRDRTALCCAIECCNYNSIRLLLSYGAKTKNCIVLIPPLIRDIENGLNKCRQAALLLIAFRRFRKSPVLASNALDIAKIIGKEIWALRTYEEWQNQQRE